MIGRDRPPPRRGSLAAVLLVGLGAPGLGAACTTKGDGLILVRLSSSQPLDHARVLVTAPGGQSVLGMAAADWPATPPLQLGIYVPKSVSGPVDVIACGFDGGGNLVAATPNDPASFTASAQPGAASAIVTIALAPGSAPPLCGTPGAGGRGGSGPGAGGSAGGSTGGSSSTAGTGGGAGAGGGAAGGAGTAGRGGATGGAAGTGGTGTTGSGGTGTGGGGGGGMWRGAVPAASVVGNAQMYPAVAVDARGNAVVVYEQGAQIWSAYYDAATGRWGPPGPIDSRGSVGSKPSVAVDSVGSYLAVWGLEPGTSLQGIWYSTSSNGTQWSPPASLTTTDAFGPVLAMNAAGIAIVAWTEQLLNGSFQAAASVRTYFPDGWQGRQVLRDGDDSAPRNPAVAMTGDGFGFVGWEQSDGGSNGWISLWTRLFAVGVSWDVAKLFATYTDHNAYAISLAANSHNDAIGTYIQVSNSNPATVQLWARRFSRGAFANNPSKVFEAGSIDTLVSPSVTLDDAGNATVAFAVETPTGFQVQTSRTDPTEASWPTAPTAMEMDNVAKDDDPTSALGRVTMPLLRNDPAGNVTLVWRKRTAASGRRFDLVSRRYAAGDWGPQILLENNTTNSVFWPALAVGANGTAVTTWYFGTSLDIWANVFR